MAGATNRTQRGLGESPKGATNRNVGALDGTPLASFGCAARDVCQFVSVRRICFDFVGVQANNSGDSAPLADRPTAQWQPLTPLADRPNTPPGGQAVGSRVDWLRGGGGRVRLGVVGGVRNATL